MPVVFLKKSSYKQFCRDLAEARAENKELQEERRERLEEDRKRARRLDQQYDKFAEPNVIIIL
ncbi:hypothetical protein ACFLW2_04950 [Chloroflexota bacterium]